MVLSVHTMEMEYLHKRQRDIFEAMCIPFLDFFMRDICRSLEEILASDLKLHGEMVEGRAMKRPEQPLPNDVYRQYMMNYNAMLSGLRDLVDNPTPRVPVLLCLDTSGSMMGAPIHELNLGVQQYMAEMKSDDLTRCSAETAVVSFDDSADCVADFDTADRLQVPEMEAGGMTCMGEGLSLGLYLLEKRKAQYKATGVDYYQPILVVMSDGHPNGDRKVWEETTERIRELGTARKLSVVAVGIGNDADMEMLAKVSPRQRPVRLNGLQFREFFAWLSRSVANVSASLPGEEPNVDLEALEALSAEPWPENTL